MKKLLVLNGPNLDMLGTREPSVYGHETLKDLECMVKEYGRSVGIEVQCFQSNSEAKLIRKIHAAAGQFDGMVYNPGAHTHYSYALRDAVGGSSVPCVEVHISDVDTREAFRHISVIAPVCVAQVKGRGFQGYCDGIDLVLSGLTQRLGEGFEKRYPAGQVRIAGIDVLKESCSENIDTSELVVEPCESAGRLERVREALSEEGMDAFFVRDVSNIAWLTAFDNVFDEEPAHSIMLTPDDVVLHTDSRYLQAAQQAAQGSSGISIDAERVTHAEFAASRVPQELGVLGIEDSMMLSQFRGLEASFKHVEGAAALRETSNFLLNLRAIKEPGEIVRMKAAQSITDAAFAHIVDFVKIGMTEREVQLELEDFMRRQGATGLAFSSIVATGANGASPHAIPGETHLEAGQCVVLDFGARFGGYCSDMTRMLFLGEPTPRIASAYAAIREANESVQNMLKPGITGAQAHEHAEQVLSQHGFAGTMGHGLGHGVGLDIHEQPVLSPKNEAPLVEGNVVTVEPGIYIPGEFGMRLEDFGVVRATGFEVFTESTHEMVII